MSETPEVVTKKRGRPRKNPVELDHNGAQLSPTTTKRAASRTAASKKSSSSSATTQQSSPTLSTSSNPSTPSSESKDAISAAIEPGPVKKKSTVSRSKKSDSATKESTSASTKSTSKKIEKRGVGINSEPSIAASTSFGAEEVRSQLSTAPSVSPTASGELERRKTNTTEKKDTTAGISEESTQLGTETGTETGQQEPQRLATAGEGKLAQEDQGPSSVTEETKKKQTIPTATTGGKSKILDALAASNQEASTIGKSTTSAPTSENMPLPTRPNLSAPRSTTAKPINSGTSKTKSSQKPSTLPRPKAFGAGPAAGKIGVDSKPQGTAVPPRLQDIRQTKDYKNRARKWTGAMVALPILIYTSYALYHRVYGDKQPLSFPGTNEFSPQQRTISEREDVPRSNSSKS